MTSVTNIIYCVMWFPYEMFRIYLVKHYISKAGIFLSDSVFCVPGTISVMLLRALKAGLAFFNTFVSFTAILNT